MNPSNSAQKIKEYYSNFSWDYKTRILSSLQEVNNFIESRSLISARNDVMIFLSKVDEALAEVDDEKFVYEILSQILIFNEFHIEKSYKNAKHLNDLRFAQVTNQIWEDCFETIVDLDVLAFMLTNFPTAVDNLLHIKEPENKWSKKFIKKSILSLFDGDEVDFYKGVIFSLMYENGDISLVNDNFDTTIYRILSYQHSNKLDNNYLFQHTGNLEKILSNKERKIRYLNLLNDSLSKAIYSLPQNNQYANEFISKITINKLPEFIKTESARLNIQIDNNTAMCTIFDKQYKLITVSTTTQLNNFSEIYLIQTIPKIVGLDCEYKNGKLAILQLATKDWLCIVDIQILPNQDWVKFFKHIFDSSIIPVGFAFGSDFAIICNTFPYLKDYFKKESRKVLCISKLVQNISEHPQAKNVIFGNRHLAGNSLKDVSDAILGGNLNKNLKAGSSWTHRPLTEEQKLYAVTDALVVILIKEKIEMLFKGKLDSVTISKLFTDAYIHYGMKSSPKTIPSNIQPLMSVIVDHPSSSSNLCIVTESSRTNNSKATKCKNCSSPNLSPIPSPLYILTHQIVTMIKDGEYYGLTEWKELEKFALNVKNMSCNDYNGFKAKLLISDSTKPSKMVIFDCGNYQILPLTFQLLRKSDKKSFNLKLSEKVLNSSKPGLSHLICLNCANVFSKESNSGKVCTNQTSKKKSQQKHVVKEEATRQKIFELLCEVFEH